MRVTFDSLMAMVTATLRDPSPARTVYEDKVKRLHRSKRTLIQSSVEARDLLKREQDNA